MELGCIYIKVKDIEKSIDFYEKLTKTKGEYLERKRWVSFSCGISLYCLDYDLNKIKSKEFDSSNYNKEYMRYISTEKTDSCKNVVFNFVTDDLIEERNRIIGLKIGIVSEIMYVNISMPYWFFIVQDPDGNEVEVCGDVL